MAEGRVFVFVKIFDKKEHADAFRDGEMLARRLKHFREIEEVSARRDEHEGTILLEDGTWSIEDDDGEFHPLNFIGPVRLNYPQLDSLNIFCMTCFASSLASEITRPLVDGLLDQIEESRSTCAAMGKHVVLISDRDRFFNRVNRALLSQGYRAHFDFVEYYDGYPLELTTISERPKWRHAFLKSRRFEKEREFRIAIRGVPGEKSLKLNVGSLRDISGYFEIQDFFDHSRWQFIPDQPLASDDE